MGKRRQPKDGQTIDINQFQWTWNKCEESTQWNYILNDLILTENFKLTNLHSSSSNLWCRSSCVKICLFIYIYICSTCKYIKIISIFSTTDTCVAYLEVRYQMRVHFPIIFPLSMFVFSYLVSFSFNFFFSVCLMSVFVPPCEEWVLGRCDNCLGRKIMESFFFFSKKYQIQRK